MATKAAMRAVIFKVADIHVPIILLQREEYLASERGAEGD